MASIGGILNEDDTPTVRSSTKGSSGHQQKHREHARARSASPADDVKHEDGEADVRMTDAKPSYRSWKKKYRKSRIKFDGLQGQNEELYQAEQKALQQIKRIAIQNEYAPSSLIFF